MKNENYNVGNTSLQFLMLIKQTFCNMIFRIATLLKIRTAKQRRSLYEEIHEWN